MAKEKRFERRAARPSLAASLEAVRQGKELAPAVTAESAPVTLAAPHQPAVTTDESTYVKGELARIGLIMTSLLLLLIFSAFMEARSGVLTNFAAQLLHLT